MVKEITFQDLIEKIKSDLFSPYVGTEAHGKAAYPVFFVDKVELEIAVEFSYEAEAGLKISIPQVFEGSATGGQGKAKTHMMKLALSPILSREELHALLEDDERMMKGIREASLMAFRKSSELAGEEE